MQKQETACSRGQSHQAGEPFLKYGPFVLCQSATALNCDVISDSSLSFHVGWLRGSKELCKALLHLIDEIQPVTTKPKGTNG